MMPLHDWTRVGASVFHDFHLAWIAELRKSLNEGLLPEGYYAMAEQHAGNAIPDLLTLHVEPRETPRDSSGGVLLAESPPQVRQRLSSDRSAVARRRTLAIRHVSNHRLVAILELVSPANKDREKSVADFVGKITDALDLRVHAVVLDVFPPGRNDPNGFHDLIWTRIEGAPPPRNRGDDAQGTLASYAAGMDRIEAFVEYPALGSAFPDMPLFLEPDRYISLPLEATYQEAFRSTPAFYREQLEG